MSDFAAIVCALLDMAPAKDVSLAENSTVSYRTVRTLRIRT